MLIPLLRFCGLNVHSTSFESLAPSIESLVPPVGNIWLIMCRETPPVALMVLDDSNEGLRSVLLTSSRSLTGEFSLGNVMILEFLSSVLSFSKISRMLNEIVKSYAIHCGRIFEMSNLVFRRKEKMADIQRFLEKVLEKVLKLSDLGKPQQWLEVFDDGNCSTISQFGVFRYITKRLWFKCSKKILPTFWKNSDWRHQRKGIRRLWKKNRTSLNPRIIFPILNKTTILI